MTNKVPNQARINALHELADAYWKSFDTRRAYEWKVNLALWPALAVFAALQFRGEIRTTSSWIVLVTITFLLLFILYIYACIWTPGLFNRNRQDTIPFQYYLELVEKELGLDENAPTAKRNKEFNSGPRANSQGNANCNDKDKGKVPSWKLWKQPWWENWSPRSQVLMTAVFVLLAIGPMWIMYFSLTPRTGQEATSQKISVNLGSCDCNVEADQGFNPPSKKEPDKSRAPLLSPKEKR